MENVGIYKPPQKNTDVIGDISDSFTVDLSTGDLEVTQSAQDKLREIIEQSDGAALKIQDILKKAAEESARKRARLLTRDRSQAA